MSKIRKYISTWELADYIFCGLLLVLVSFNKLMPILLVLLGLIALFKRRKLNESLRIIKWTEPSIWFILFFAVHIIGLFSTSNFDYARTDIGMKLSFIIIPVLMIFIKTKMSYRQVIDLILIGLLITGILSFIFAIYRSIYNVEDNHWAYFTESYFTFQMHRSYYATYMVIGALISLIRFFQFRKAIYFVLTLFFCISTILTFSKAGILIMIIMITCVTLILTSRYYSRITGISLSIILAFVLILSFTLNSTLKGRFVKMYGAVTNVSVVNNASVESNQSRIIMWSTSLKIIERNLLTGVGTGDVSDELDSLNKKLGNFGVAERSYNSHNQYLNSTVQLGLLGGIPLLMILILSMIKAIRNKAAEYFVVVIIFAISFLFESFLETQAGIIPVTYLLVMFSLKSDELNHTDLRIKKLA